MNISSCTANIKTLSFQFISFAVQHEFLSEYLAVNNAREHQSCMAKQKKPASRDAGLEIQLCCHIQMRMLAARGCGSPPERGNLKRIMTQLVSESCQS